MLLDVAKQINRPASQVSLNWVATQPGITSTIIGASKLSQLEDNLRYAEFEIPAELLPLIEAVSLPDFASKVFKPQRGTKSINGFAKSFVPFVPLVATYRALTYYEN